MRAYPLRLKDELADAAKAHAERIGISFNALVAVALDAYLREPGTPGAKREPSKTKRPANAKPATRGGAKRANEARARSAQAAGGDGERSDRFDYWHPDPTNWRNFNDPEQWPHVDPDWERPEHLLRTIEDGCTEEGLTQEGEAAFRELEAAYWATHERPTGPWFEGKDVPY
jgi:hypothetical protein